MAVWIPKNAIRLASKQSACAVNYAIQVSDYSTEPRIIKNATTASLKRGTGGRSSFNGVVCTVFGATGFLGRYVCNRLGKIGTQLILPYRGDHYDCMRLKLCGDLGQVLFHPYHLKDEESIRKSVKYSNVVINLVGREFETKNFTYDDVNVEGARTLARISKECNVERFIHVSCLNANPHPKPLMVAGGSKFLKSKWAGEEAVREEFPEATIVRPSVIYGQRDRFITNYLTNLRRSMRGIPLWKKGEETQKQPIYVGDVAAGITALVKDPRTAGQTYQFVGSDRYKLADLVNWIAKLERVDAEAFGFAIYDINKLPTFQAKVYINELLSTSNPWQNLHWEGLEIEHTSDDVKEGLPMLEDLGITPMSMEKRMIWEVRPWRKDNYLIPSIPENELPEAPKPIC